MSNVEDNFLYILMGCAGLAVLSLTFLMLNSVAGVSFETFMGSIVALGWVVVLGYMITRQYIG